MAHHRPATLRDVAAYAGVSIKTVSNVVNNWPYVSDETRKRVLDAIQAVGYRPNQAARSLVTGKTQTIGVLIPDIANPFFGAAMRGCEDVLFQNGYGLLLSNTNEDLSRERSNLDLLLSRGVDALLLWGTRICCEELEEIIGPNLPLVTIELDDQPRRPNHTNVNIDNEYGAWLATHHLLESGYSRVAHLAGPEERFTAKLRLQGYRRALEEMNRDYQEDLVIHTFPTIADGKRAALELLNKVQPDAIFCYNDLLAFGTLLAARDLGIVVPKQLGIVGFDDIAMAALSQPPLSTVRIAQYDLGYLAGEIVLRHMRKEIDQPTSFQFPVELLIRSSSQP